MKEAYSNRLLREVLYDTGLDGLKHLNLIDPFSGSGTTGVSAGDLVRDGILESADVTAFEVNPFLHLVSLAKMRAHTLTGSRIRRFAGEVARRAMSRKDGVAATPELSTFSNIDFFPARNLLDLLALKASADTLMAEEPDAEDWVFIQIALAATVEPSSNLRRDGRALRRTPGKAALNPIDVFLGVAQMIAEDTEGRNIKFRSSVVRADSRTLPSPPIPVSDLALFSPPYPNNIDYTEVYKLEAWFLNLYADAEQFSRQRRQTLRSHSSLRWGDTYRYRTSEVSGQVSELLAPLASAVPIDHYENGRREVVLGYADDMHEAMRSTFHAVRPGGAMAIVVGNSMHGKSGSDYVIASDLLIARLAEFAGFRIERIEVARYPKRRLARSAYLRESVVFARKD